MQANLRNGMITMDRSLIDLYAAGRVSREAVLLAAKKPEEVMQHLR
jgi:Tfp pilus assembly pilus retraction ATPase PilT